ncbi:MAG TPA: ATP-binding protein [Candidatus Cloacimonas sp.]|nr:ATP-binding protein [Candidatus Cloacimonas sp.]
MLTKLWVNNYRCLVNFEIEFDSLTLLLGPNGGGKTSIFDILYNLRRLIIDNAKVYEVFFPEDLTAWLDSNEQTFELQVEGNGGIYIYRLVISHQRELGKLRVERETLHYDHKVIFSFEKGDIHLYNDYFKEGAVISFDWMFSGLSMVVPRQDNTKLTWFKDWINKLFILNLEPKAIHSVSEDES